MKIFYEIDYNDKELYNRNKNLFINVLVEFYQNNKNKLFLT